MDAENYSFASRFNEKYNATTRKIVRILSENSRISISDLSKQIGMSRLPVRNKLRRIEEEFGVHYTAEFNETLLRVAAQHIIAVKFDQKPNYDKIKALLEKSYMPQLAVTMKGGSYDMIIYAVSTSTREYAHWDKSMQIKLSEYGAEWKPSEVVHRHLGFCPLRNELLDRMLIPHDYRGILKLLNMDSRIPFRRISQELKMHFNTVAYNYKKMIRDGYIKRFTITMDKPKDLSTLAFFSKFKPKEGFEKTSSIARKMVMDDDQNSLIGRTILSASLIGSYDLLIMGIFDDYETATKKYLGTYKQIYSPHGIRTAPGEVDKVILGSLPIRSIDTKKEYNTIVWDPNIEPSKSMSNA